ncbi:uncharacterized protein [Elaeis guineensis]|uniref:uncharacterized protein isoform X1 n=1 Tax=Elaeis guineensis var. tenera TaxID=51953 RepID=UPI003C6D97B3
MEADFAVISSPRLIFPSCAVWNSEGEETTWTEGVDSYVKSVLGLCWVLLGAFWSFYSDWCSGLWNVSNPRFALLVNGVPTEWFYRTIGLRQRICRIPLWEVA